MRVIRFDDFFGAFGFRWTDLSCVFCTSFCFHITFEREIVGAESLSYSMRRLTEEVRRDCGGFKVWLDPKPKNKFRHFWVFSRIIHSLSFLADFTWSEKGTSSVRRNRLTKFLTRHCARRLVFFPAFIPKHLGYFYFWLGLGRRKFCSLLLIAVLSNFKTWFAAYRWRLVKMFW